MTDSKVVDLSIMPAVDTDSIEKKWTKKGNVIFGLNSLFFDESFDKAKVSAKVFGGNKKNRKKIITLSFGGSDPFGLTKNIIKLLLASDFGKDYELQVIVGPFFKDKEKINSLLKNSQFAYNLIVNPTDVAKYFVNSHLAIIAYGTSFYQFAYLGVPTLNIAIHSHDIKIAKKIEKIGLGHYIGFRNNIKKTKLFEKIHNPRHLSINIRNNIGMICAEILKLEPLLRTKLLFLGCNTNQIPYIQEAKKLGYFVVGTDINPMAPAIKYLDRYYKVSYEDYNGLIKIGKKRALIHGKKYLQQEVSLLAWEPADLLITSRLIL